MASVRPLTWVGSSLDDLKKFPPDVQRVMGYALDLAQQGAKHSDAKPLTGLAGVFEVVDDLDGDTYRAVYTVKLVHAVYVLHAFEKKSKRGIATPPRDLHLIQQRLKEARELDKRQGGPTRDRAPFVRVTKLR